jgi:hypothetical protein
MANLKPFFKNMSILNLLLAGTMLLLASHIFMPAFDLNLRYTPSVDRRIMRGMADNPREKLIKYLPLSEYLLVAEENLFHPQRRIIVEKVEKKEEHPLPKPEIVLYGTLITDTLSLAYLEDLKSPHNTPGRGRRQLALKKGDILSGFSLKEIEEDKIVLEKGEEKMTVSIYESHKSRKQTSTVPAVNATSVSASPARQFVRPSALPPKQAISPGFKVKEKDRKFFDILNRINQ